MIVGIRVRGIKGMELFIGDKIIYKDVYVDSFKALIIDVWVNDSGDIFR